MNDFIRREELRQRIFGITFVDQQQYINVMFDCINNAPAADVEPVVRGEWIKNEKIKSESTVRCSICGNLISYWYKTKRCSECGAYMKEADHDA